jgi:hypothetical protein
LKKARISCSWEFFCGAWSRKTGQKAISASTSQVKRGPANRSRSWGSRLPDAKHITQDALLLTNRTVYIECRGFATLAIHYNELTSVEAKLA